MAALFNALRYSHGGEQQAETHVPGWYEPGRHVNCDIDYADTPGSHMLCGQIGWSPKLESINGRIVFERSVVPPIGLLQGSGEVSQKIGNELVSIPRQII